MAPVVSPRLLYSYISCLSFTPHPPPPFTHDATVGAADDRLSPPQPARALARLALARARRGRRRASLALLLGRAAVKGGRRAARSNGGHGLGNVCCLKRSGQLQLGKEKKRSRPVRGRSETAGQQQGNKAMMQKADRPTSLAFSSRRVAARRFSSACLLALYCLDSLTCTTSTLSSRWRWCRQKLHVSGGREKSRPTTRPAPRASFPGQHRTSVERASRAWHS